MSKWFIRPEGGEPLSQVSIMFLSIGRFISESARFVSKLVDTDSKSVLINQNRPESAGISKIDRNRLELADYIPILTDSSTIIAKM